MIASRLDDGRHHRSDASQIEDGVHRALTEYLLVKAARAARGDAISQRPARVLTGFGVPGRTPHVDETQRTQRVPLELFFETLLLVE
jgi:hypothetical protein